MACSENCLILIDPFVSSPSSPAWNIACPVPVPTCGLRHIWSVVLMKIGGDDIPDHLYRIPNEHHFTIEESNLRR